MMRRFLILFILAFELFSAVSCRKNDELLPKETFENDIMKVEIGETHTDFEGIGIKVVDVVWEESEIKLKTEWINNTAYEIMYGEYFEIEKEKDGEWISCQAVDGIVFTDIGYLLESGSGSSMSMTYNLTNRFNISENGKYRLSVKCSVYDTEYSRKATDCKLWADFTVVLNGNSNNSENTENTENNEKITYIDFIPQYIRTDGGKDGAEYPMVNIIASKDELNDYYERNKEIFSLGRRNGFASDSTTGFLDACDRYDDTFFENSSLILIVIEEGSGSIRHNIDDVKIDTNGCLYVNISSVVPEALTCDMAEWHIILELSDDFIPKNADDVSVFKDGNLITRD